LLSSRAARLDERRSAPASSGVDRLLAPVNPRMADDTKRIRRRVLLTFLIPLAAGELFARVWVASRYTKERIEQLTTHSPTRGRFASYPYQPYSLNPGFPGHNSLGFRGDPIQLQKPAGVKRVACIGASTTYGSLTDPVDSYPAELGNLMSGLPEKWEVVNAGVLGYLSNENLIDLQLRVLPLDPDVLLILPGRNEIFPQAYNNFKLDYTHFRRPGFNFAVSNYVHKEIFKWSRLALLACTVKGDRFGWSEADEHPLYGGMMRENRPTPAEAIRNIQDPSRMTTYRRSLESMIEICRGRGILVVMCTMQECPEKFALDELPRDAVLNQKLGELVERLNDVAREVARQFDVPIVETAQLSARKDLFLDDTHLTLEGHRLQARIIFDALAPLIGKR
jgi:lysophospholipase L1-like esterase